MVWDDGLEFQNETLYVEKPEGKVSKPIPLLGFPGLATVLGLIGSPASPVVAAPLAQRPFEAWMKQGWSQAWWGHDLLTLKCIGSNLLIKVY